MKKVLETLRDIEKKVNRIQFDMKYLKMRVKALENKNTDAISDIVLNRTEDAKTTSRES